MQVSRLATSSRVLRASVHEEVQWMVLREPLEASRAQIERLRRLEGFNARSALSLYRRQIDEF